MSRVLIVGCGFVGEAAADRLHAAGHEVLGWTASAESAARLTAEKPYPVTAHDIADTEGVRRSAEEIGPLDAIVDSVSSGRGGGAEAYRRVYLEGARSLLAAFGGVRLVYTGSTSVYAQTDGSWVDESSPAEPDRETGRILRETEDALLAGGGIVLRLAGLYGPGRSVLLRKTLDGTATVEGDGLRWLNFCHRDDAASAVVLAAAGRLPAGLYNVADDAPVTQGDCCRQLAAICNQPPPPTGPIDPDRKRGWTSKRVNNLRLRESGWAPMHPSFLGWAKNQWRERC